MHDTGHVTLMKISHAKAEKRLGVMAIETKSCGQISLRFGVGYLIKRVISYVSWLLVLVSTTRYLGSCTK